MKNFIINSINPGMVFFVMLGFSIISNPLFAATNYYLQVGSYKSADFAQRELTYRKNNNHLQGVIRQTAIKGISYYQLQFGPYETPQQAKRVKQQLGVIAQASYIRTYPRHGLKTSIPYRFKTTQIIRRNQLNPHHTKMSITKKPFESPKHLKNMATKKPSQPLIKPIMIAKKTSSLPVLPLIVPPIKASQTTPKQVKKSKPILLYQYRDPLGGPETW